MSKRIRIVGFTGCLRNESYNKAALRAAQELLPQDTDLEILSIADLPSYAEEGSASAEVKAFKASLAQADAVLIITPEYKGLLSNTLKNALNWAGRDVLRGKLTAIAGFGREPSEQPLLRRLLALHGASVLEQPSLYASRDHFDAVGNLLNASTRQQMSDLLLALSNKARDSKAALVS